MASRVAPANKMRTSRIKRQKDKFFKANSINSALYPVMFFGQVLGLPTKCFNKNDAWKTKLIIFIMLASFSSFVYCCHITLFQEMTQETIADSFSLLKYSHIIKILIGLTSVSCLYLSSFFDAAHHRTNMKHLDAIDEVFHRSGVTLHYSKIKSRVICAMVTKTMFNFCVYLFDNMLVESWREQSEVFNIVMLHTIYFPGVLSSAICLKFSSLVMVANSSLQIINAELALIFEKKLTPEEEVKDLNIHLKKTKKRQIDILKRMQTRERDSIVLQRITVCWRAYDKTCDYVGSVNDTYPIKLLIIFMTSFTMIVYNLFLFLSTLGWTLREAEDQTVYPLLGSSILVTIMHIFHCYTAIQNCSVGKDLVSVIRL